MSSPNNIRTIAEQRGKINSQERFIEGQNLVIERQQKQLEELRALLQQAQAQLTQQAQQTQLAQQIQPNPQNSVKIAIIEHEPVLYGYMLEQFLRDIFRGPFVFEFVRVCEEHLEKLEKYDLVLIVEMSRNAACVLENPRHWPLTPIAPIKDHVPSVVRLFVDEVTQQDGLTLPIANLGEGFGGGVFNRTPAEIEASLLFYFTQISRDGKPRMTVLSNPQNEASREMLKNIIQMILESKTR